MVNEMGVTRKQFVRKWLRNQLVQLVNVQKTTFAQPSLAAVSEADLIVHTWAGVLIYVHLLDEPLKAARVRHLLESATSTGIVSLFILDAELLPRQGERVDSRKWFLVFAQLANDRVYTYHIGKGGPAIRAAQFIPVGRDEVEIRYGAQIPIMQLRYLRQTVKHSALKGYWLIGDFETEKSAHIPAYRVNSDWRGNQQNTNGSNGQDPKSFRV